MRQYEVRIAPDSGWFHPFERRVAEADGVQRVAVHRVRLVDDESGAILFELGGDRERAEALVDDQFDSFEYWLDAVDGRIFVYSPFVPTGPIAALLEIRRELPLFLEPPHPYGCDGDLRVTCLATESAFARATAALPEDVSVTLEAKRDFDPSEGVFLATLTDQQRRIFETAIDLGYYGSPRDATYEEIGQAVGLAGGTVGEHLRKIEAKLVEHAVSVPVEESVTRRAP